MNGSLGRERRSHHWCALLTSLALCGSPASAQDTLPAPARHRMLSVLDARTGDPVAGAQVIDLATGRRGVTTEAGTVSLAFLQPGTTPVNIRKIGYQSDTVSITTSPRDTTPVTVRLTPISHSLPAVLATGCTSGDTVRRLELSGFYDRRKSSAAPASAFVTADDVERWRPTLLSDLKYHTGRDLAGCTYYLDGVLLNAPSARRGRGGLRQGIDALVEPDQVAGLEVYTHAGELPSQYNATRTTGCVVLIWTK